MARGRLITFEGLDGSGKTTQLERVAGTLRAAGHIVLATREPGGTPLGEAIRHWVLQPGALHPAPRSELALMFAARAQHIERVIAPALGRGEIVLCDRFTDASEAYQGAGRGLGAETVRTLHRLLCGGLLPDLTLILDLDAAAALARARMRLQQNQSAEGRFEQEDGAFFAVVGEAYRAIAAREPQRCALIPADGPADEVQRRIAAAIETRLSLSLTPRP